ncbi:N-acetylmuramoyl-L-alanine amidase AmpDh3, partial [Pseudomonas aeruginosa]|nr:N-acetylmuramoyl-L-alanine amidase AmpDh3 [Pseudomonas aeruginosa]
DGLPPRADLLEAFRLYGYALPATVDDAYFASLLRAFQMHFRPENYGGALDVETAAILYALNEKYPA